MSRTPLPKLVLSLVLVGASAALVGAGVMYLTTDAKTPRIDANQAPVTVPEVPPATAIPPLGADAFNRPMFNRDRAQGPDKAPPATTDNGDPSTSSGTSNAPGAPRDMSAMTVKGIIVSDRGARAALQAPGSGALTWVSAGDTIDGWKVDSITASTVRISNGDETAEIKIRED